MSAPRIKISQCYEAGFEWKCTAATHHQCDGPIREWVRGRTIAAAADAGRAHLAEHHTPAQGYCRSHGVHRSVCGCRVASVDPDGLKVAHSVSCDYCNDLCDYCGEIDGVCGRDFPCCTHDNPLQTAHNQSREGA